jgi:hypothetical protein
MQPTFPELEVPSAVGGQRELPFESPIGALRPLAGESSRRTFSSGFENPD